MTTRKSSMPSSRGPRTFINVHSASLIKFAARGMNHEQADTSNGDFEAGMAFYRQHNFLEEARPEVKTQTAYY
ncbi:uncharacterized protein N7498_001618 [Penicillium cinerascens]|uniref:Uncharacterized protein n=1 Tax=Penicillium cinerascens TaxID=70096 RepID=A0A9W9TAB9_9EURO|nr:uncharacterized protein N7498_001618 [Penicillium cinerascens]KAJ5215211.1 hypothetical protein N7498_001618 [Penicillium cinerascens]